MTDAAEAAVAAPEPVSAPVEQVQTPEPVHSDMADIKAEQQAKADAERLAKKEPEEKKPASIRDSMKAADEKLRKDAEAKEKPKAEPAKEDKPKAEEKPVEKKEDAPARDESGKFVAKDGQKPAEAPPQEQPKPEQKAEQQPSRFGEAPKRFSDDAKTAWNDAPEPVKAEIHRAVKELETGIQQYREFVEPLKPYHQLAQQHNTTIQRALDGYLAMERTLKSDPDRGMQLVADYAGINLREFAAKLLNQSPDQVQTQQDNTIRGLRAELAQLKQQLGGVSEAIQQQRVSSAEAQVREFAATHPRMDELGADIAFFLESGRANDLSEAYELAERLNPAPAQAIQQQPVTPAPQTTEAQTLRGSKSITGAPSAGSTPAASEPSSSIREALRRAASRAG